VESKGKGEQRGSNDQVRKHGHSSPSMAISSISMIDQRFEESHVYWLFEDCEDVILVVFHVWFASRALLKKQGGEVRHLRVGYFLYPKKLTISKLVIQLQHLSQAP